MQRPMEADNNQVAMCRMFSENDLPCGCYDGE